MLCVAFCFTTVPYCVKKLHTSINPSIEYFSTTAEIPLLKYITFYILEARSPCIHILVDHETDSIASVCLMVCNEKRGKIVSPLMENGIRDTRCDGQWYYFIWLVA